MSNLIGTVLFIRAALPHLRRQGGGRLIQVSSEGGQVADPGLSSYHAGKWGQEGFIEAVSQEVAPLGISLCLVEPGPTGTGFLSGIDMGEALPDYAASPVAGLREAPVAGGFGVVRGDPTLMAQAIIALADAPETPLRVPTGSTAWWNIDRATRVRLDLLAGQEEGAAACDVAEKRA